MSFIKKNLWAVGFVVILVGAFGAMWLAGRGNVTPPANSIIKDEVAFTISPDDHVKGAENAIITLVEFGDFQCPACGAYYPIVENVLKNYPDKLQIIYKHYPLRSIHPRAQISAQAAEAAGQQGRFWEMYSLLFQRQSAWVNKLGAGIFEDYAKELGLNVEQFKVDMDSRAIKDKIDADLKLGIESGVGGTPTFYLNGKYLVNPKNEAEFNAIIKSVLKATP